MLQQRKSFHFDLQEKLSDPGTDEEEAGAAEQREEAHEGLQPQDEEQPRQEVKTEEEELMKQVDDGQQIPEAEKVQDHQVPVHQGEPEM